MAKIFLAGDVVNIKNETGLVCSKKLSEIIKKADFSICNFEAPIAGHGEPIPKCGPNLYQRPETLPGLKKQGFDLILLANNHIMDYGRAGLEATINYANEVGLATIGAGDGSFSAYKPLIKEIDGIKIGIVNAGEAQFGVIDYFERNAKSGYAWINHSLVDKNVIRLKKECDFVMVLSHAGLENYPIPQKEWRERYKHLCELGADIVVGTHPHVAQGYEKYKNSIIFYSLGNFYFDYGPSSNASNSSYSLLLDFQKGKPISFKPIYHSTENGNVNIASKGTEVDLVKLCDMLGDDYVNLHDKMIMKAYENVRWNLVTSMSSFPTDGTITGTLRAFFSSMLGRRKKLNKGLIQLHYTRNETYYYVMRHASELCEDNSNND